MSLFLTNKFRHTHVYPYIYTHTHVYIGEALAPTNVQSNRKKPPNLLFQTFRVRHKTIANQSQCARAAARKRTSSAWRKGSSRSVPYAAQTSGCLGPGPVMLFIRHRRARPARSVRQEKNSAHTQNEGGRALLPRAHVSPHADTIVHHLV